MLAVPAMAESEPKAESDAALVSASPAVSLSVVADTPPIHSLVSMVLGDQATPALLISNGATPHHYSLKPSEASLLAEADILFWTSANLTPWLPRAIESIAAGTPAVELLATPGSRILPARESAIFSHKAHAEDDEHDDHKEDDYHADKHDNHKKEDEPVAQSDEHSDSELVDPHAWLDPQNAQLWLEVIATTLAVHDPANSSYYEANAQRGITRIDEVIDHIRDELSEHQTAPYIVFHDSYHYFEEQFDLLPLAAINLSDATEPSIKQITQLRQLLQPHEKPCVFSEPQFSQRLIDTVTRGMDIKHGSLDPLGSRLQTGQTLYTQLLLGLSTSLSACFTQTTG